MDARASLDADSAVAAMAAMMVATSSGGEGGGVDSFRGRGGGGGVESAAERLRACTDMLQTALEVPPCAQLPEFGNWNPKLERVMTCCRLHWRFVHAP